jgi:hypothetical protein
MSHPAPYIAVSAVAVLALAAVSWSALASRRRAPAVLDAPAPGQALAAKPAPAPHPPPPPLPNRAFAIMDGVELTGIGPPGTFAVQVYYSYAVVAPDSRAAASVVGTGNFPVSYGWTPTDVKAACAAAIRLEMHDQSLQVVFLSGGTF